MFYPNEAAAVAAALAAVKYLRVEKKVWSLSFPSVYASAVHDTLVVKERIQISTYTAMHRTPPPALDCRLQEGARLELMGCTFQPRMERLGQHRTGTHTGEGLFTNSRGSRTRAEIDVAIFGQNKRRSV